ncbi:MAG: hypothetical protein ACR2NU_02040 [Aeoliella sp.]
MQAPEAYYSGSPVWLTNLLGIDAFRTVATLQCYSPGNKFSYGRTEDGRLQIDREYQTGVVDEDLVFVSKLTHLRTLSLEANHITDQGLINLESLLRLETLNLSNTTITDRGLVTLAKLPHLRDLDISRTDVTDASVEFLEDCRALESLDIEMTNITPEGVLLLRQGLPNCQIAN